MIKYPHNTHGGSYDSSAGFTLIELLVALAIFTTVVTVAMGALVSIIAANKQARSLQLVMDNLHFAVDEMSRSVRTGTEYTYSGSGNTCADSFVFSYTDTVGTAVNYRCNGGRLEKREDGGSYVPITSEEIVITHFRVYDRPTSQPRALITILGEASIESGADTTPFSLQTTVSQRKLNI